MKHYGKHEFPQEIDVQLSNIFNAYFGNKLNIPLHRDVTETDFGDVFLESNAVKFINFEQYIVELLSLDNKDVLKSLFLSEIFFDYFMNFGEDRNSTESFHEDINLGTDLVQHKLSDDIIDSTIYVSELYNGNYCIELYNFENNNDIIDIQNVINSFIEFNLSLRCYFYYDTTNMFDDMFLFNLTYYDSTSGSLKLYIDSTGVNNDITNANGIKLVVYEVELTTDKLYVNLPYHYHLVEELSDLDAYTNKPNGYPKLIDDINLRLPFNQYLWLVQSKIEDSLFLKEQKDEFLKSNCFIAEYTTNIITDVNYTAEDVVMQDDTVTEYTYVDMTIDFEDIIDFRIISNNQKLNNTYNTEVYDTTQYQDKYLCEFLSFNMSNMINPNITDIEDIINVNYQYIDKTDVENNIIKVYDIDIGNNIITIFNGYYDISILQAAPSTIPSAILRYINICKDDYNKVFITKPIVYDTLIGEKTISFSKDSDVLIKYNNESSTMSIDIYKFNVFKSEQEHFDTISVVSSINDILYDFNRGLYKFSPDNEVDTYNIYTLERV